MRDLLFKNLTSDDKRRRIISSRESSQENGLRTNVYRHLLFNIINVKKTEVNLAKTKLYVVKKRNTKRKSEMFYCRIKGSIYFTKNNKIYLINYIHSLRITLKPAVKVTII